MTSKTSKSISSPESSLHGLLGALCLGLALLLTPADAAAQQVEARADTVVVVVDSATVAEVADAVAGALGRKQERKPRFINGFGVGADLVGLVQKLAGSDWAQMEVLARMNILERYFPVFELGLGEADHEGRDLDNRFRVRAPYFRVGADYNFRASHADGNRFFAGLRYGFSAYKYDLTSPVPLTDPVWGTSQPLDLRGLSGNAHWGEVVLGVETRLWTIVRLGWDMRFKLLITQKSSEIGLPWYIPGLGKQPDGIAWGGTFKLMFDI